MEMGDEKWEKPSFISHFSFLRITLHASPKKMAKNKTTPSEQSVADFIASFVTSPAKQQESHALVAFMERVTGYPAKMWGPSIIGFGMYHYTYASGHSGEAPIIGFSPRKAAFSLYVYSGLAEHEAWIANLGKFKKGKACIYVNKLHDLDLQVLEKLIQQTMDYSKETYTIL